ncbi:MAG: hypothetical protein L0Z50_40115 [Verrucomicrobiales bacterium]|nr:hypothetical protein [Verrucomicrobiales bacterium]
MTVTALAAVSSNSKVEEGKWAFEPPRDDFSPESLLDLRYLNEKVAGESGYVTLSRDGNDFLLGNGKPARFWALNTSYDKENLDRHARFLAKRGVNMVRFHGNITPKENLMSINREERDKLWRTVASMKKQGIYVTFSPYWAGASRARPAMGYLDDGGNGNWGVLFFDAKLQATYKAWWKQVLAEPNPYTGIPLANDPALAILQLQNEDSLLFFTSQNIKGAAKKELRRQFAEFAIKQNGSLTKASEAWAGATVSRDQDAPDDFANNEAALYIVWEMTQRRGGVGAQKRLSDQVEFFTETMRRFNRTMSDYLRTELKCKALINAGNWRTADNIKLLDAERYSYSANEVMGVNRYYSGAHEGKYNGWAIVNGDTFTDESVLLHPYKLPVTLKQPDGFPMIVPESSWVPPQGYQSEGPFMIAAYQSLNGVDAFYWFATREEDWRHPGSANGYLPSEGKWVCATPMLLGQWPAAALFYRAGHVKQGEPVVYEQRSMRDLWERKTPIIAEDAGFDPNRDRENFSQTSNIKTGVSPLAYLVGPVLTKYGGDPAQSKVANLNQFIDASARKVKSITGELEVDHANGWCMLNSPKAQGVTGFLRKAGAFKLRDTTISSGNDYATVLVVSMDDEDLNASGTILVQVGTVARPTGWKTKPVEIRNKSAEEIVSYGKAPWQIIKGDITVSVANATVKTAHVLDANGMSVATIPLKDVGGTKQFHFPEEALYVVLR